VLPRDYNQREQQQTLGQNKCRVSSNGIQSHHVHHNYDDGIVDDSCWFIKLWRRCRRHSSPGGGASGGQATELTANSVSRLDQASRVLYPATFLAFNIFYWSTC
jgi:hypothetical protein